MMFISPLFLEFSLHHLSIPALSIASIYLAMVNQQELPMQNITFFAILLVVLILISALISGAEVAFFTIGEKERNMLRVRQKPGARQAIKLLENPRLLQATLLLANYVINICVILIANYLIDLFINYKENLILSYVIKLLVILIIVVLFGEIIPRVYATQYNIRVVLSSAGVIHVLQRMLGFASSFIVKTSENIEATLQKTREADFLEKEINEAVDATIDENASAEEKNILKGIIKFSNITVRQVMRARLDVKGIPYDLPFREVIRQVAALHHARLPVYEEDLDHIKGMLYSHDLLAHLDKGDDFDWHAILRPAYFVPEHKLIEDLLHEFQTQEIHFAVVVDEFGGTSGIVTLEDIVEEVIGDIRDEFDEEDQFYAQIDADTFVFDGKVMLNDVCRIMDLSPDTFDEIKGDSDSLAGLVLEIARKFPQVNEVLKWKDFEFTVLEIDRMRIQKIKVRKNPFPDE
ncbi:gliding motility-associated protein GldE [Thermoflavifilum thermophilum]|uniref:Gliding motility-associated protein GldE n=1 Tax=Thermoflavifilum thermophilum TaxID=1393122 RepID=A0A1I7NAV5_9BACT|nr:gliding motility-associated protein GldE [Thermoflavifilum thermophilum]SFV31814.1 gliding motility-associated protein GldE [Thermoflavifilum thermophilum]